MTMQNSATLDEAIKSFLERGGKVQELEGYTPVPRPALPAPRPSKPVKEAKPRRRRGSSRNYPRDSLGLTEAIAAKAKILVPTIQKLLDQGLKLSDIREQCEVGSQQLREVIQAYGLTRKQSVASTHGIIVELLVEGLIAGRSLVDTCKVHGISRVVGYKCWAKYAEGNPTATSLCKGRGNRPATDDENVALMILLYQELTGKGQCAAARSLGIGESRAAALIAQVSV
jgi:hypothetical protein